MVRRLELVPHWRKSWKWASVQWSTIGILVLSIIDVLQETLISISPDLIKHIPHGSSIAMIVFGLSIVGRIIRLKPKENDNGN